MLCHQSPELEVLIEGAIAFGFEQLRANNGFYIEIVRNLHQLDNKKATDILQAHFFELWVFVFTKFFIGADAARINIKAFIIINSTLYTMMSYCTQVPPRFTEADIQQELTSMILHYLKS